MHLSKRIALTLVIACLTPALSSCGSEQGEARESTLGASAWLGSAEGWGLLGLPLEGGPLTYRSASTLESPTWAPPELERIERAWPGEDAIWIEFFGSRIARYDYATGHLLSYEDADATEIAVALQGERALVTAPNEGALGLVGTLEPWRYELGGRLARLESAGDVGVVAIVESESQTELVILQPPEGAALGRLVVDGVRDLVVTPWGERLYYLPGGAADPAVRALTLPDLEDAGQWPLPEPAQAIAVSPSGHRIYVAAGDSLHVFDRLNERPIRRLVLPGTASALRFSVTGANLMARLAGEDRVAIIRVGVDSVIGVIPAEWNERLPAAFPGDRLVAQEGGELVLFETRSLVEVVRADVDDPRLWLPVQWQPPRPRQELARPQPTPVTIEVAPAVVGEEGEASDPEAEAPAGHYAVVSAARDEGGVDNLAGWLRSVGYPGRVDRHEDVMGQIWYRAMVGPYASRSLAEEAAQSLGSRYGYKPWILQVGEPEGSSPADSTESGDEVGEEDTGGAGEDEDNDSGIGSRRVGGGERGEVGAKY